MKKPIFKKWWFWLIVAVIVIGIGSVGANPNVPSSSGTKETASVNTDNEIDGKLVEILSAEVGGKDYEGNPTVVVTYKYTNNSDNAASFSVSFYDKVFQSGIECSPDYLYDGDDNASKEIRPGASIEVKKSYVLNDMIADIEVEVSGFISLDGTIITKTFAIKG